MTGLLRGIAFGFAVFALGGLAVSTASQARGNKAGQYDYLSLVLSWSPTYCAGSGRRKNELQCSGQRPFAFVLHGLWPQHNRGYPSSCRVQWRPWVPKSVVSGMLDIMPSKSLVIHEYKKHGTCMGVDATKYYQVSRLLYNEVNIPDAFKAPDKPFVTSVQKIRDQFLKANPKLKPNMLAVACSRKDRLKEVRICFDKSGKFTRCGSNENQTRLCRARKIRVPAIRVGRRNLPQGRGGRELNSDLWRRSKPGQRRYNRPGRQQQDQRGVKSQNIELKFDPRKY